MIATEVRRIAREQELGRIDEAVDAFERDRRNLLGVRGQDDGEILSNLLAARFVRERLDRGQDLNAALRDLGRRVRAVLAHGRRSPK